jgi:hypothetical protein
MSEQLRVRADARLEAALRERGVADPRDAYRQRLRALREVDETLFDRAREHYNASVLPALAGDSDALAEWIDYGRFLAELLAPGRIVAIDRTGRALPYVPPPPADTMLLHVPSDGGRPIVTLALPAAPSPAQQATYDLLVLGRESL